MVSRKARSEATRKALIQQGSRFFAERGYEGASLDAIAKEAHVNKAMVSYHFGGKQGLYSVVLLESIRKIAMKLEPARDSSLSPPERLRLFIACMVEAITETPEFPFIVLREEMSGGDRIGDDVMKEFAGFYELDRDILQAGMATGEFRKVDSYEAHLSIVGSLAFFMASQPLREARMGRGQMPEKPTFESYGEYVAGVFLQGLANLDYV